MEKKELAESRNSRLLFFSSRECFLITVEAKRPELLPALWGTANKYPAETLAASAMDLTPPQGEEKPIISIRYRVDSDTFIIGNDTPAASYGFPWDPMGFYGFSPRNSRKSRVLRSFYGFSWENHGFFVFYGILWVFMVFHGFLFLRNLQKSRVPSKIMPTFSFQLNVLVIHSESHANICLREVMNFESRRRRRERSKRENLSVCSYQPSPSFRATLVDSRAF